jgi:phosphatidylglycerophosphatase A
MLLRKGELAQLRQTGSILRQRLQTRLHQPREVVIDEVVAAEKLCVCVTKGFAVVN